MARISCLLERRAFDVMGPPPVIVKRDILVRLHLDAHYARVWNYYDEINLGSQTPIPRGKIKRVQRHPVVRTRSEQIEDVTFSRGSPIVHERRYQPRHRSMA
jgi:hypothetical protein